MKGKRFLTTIMTVLVALIGAGAVSACNKENTKDSLSQSSFLREEESVKASEDTVVDERTSESEDVDSSAIEEENSSDELISSEDTESSERECIHSWSSTVAEQAACEKAGVKVFACGLCGESYTESIPALSHDEKQHEGKTPTCTQIGWKEYVTCEREGCTYTTYTELPATGVHSWDGGEQTKTPTCTKEGEMTYTCTECKTATKTQSLDVLPHEYSQDLKYNDTHHYYECECGKKKDETKHSPSEPATATTPQTCTVCGYVMQEETGILFNTLSVDGVKVYGKVSNATAEFSFIDEILMKGDVSYVVDNDKDCNSPIASKTVDLEIGDNVFYVLESVGNRVKLYTVTLRRKPIYEVTFDTQGGTSAEKQSVEEDGFATPPQTARAGYTLVQWSWDFSAPITENVRITASWRANKDTPYTVEYYLQNLEDDGYTKEESIQKAGETDSTATAEIKAYEHFTHIPMETENGTIDGNGSLVLKVYYTRNAYTVTFHGNGGLLAGGEEFQTVKYGGCAVAPVYEREGYSLTGFDKELSFISENINASAEWKINEYTLTVVFGNGQADKYITQEYNTAIESIAEPTREGYNFIGWDKRIPAYMPAENQTVTAVWQESGVFVVADGVIKGLTEYGEETYTVLTIPSKIDGAEIVGIEEYAFNGNKNLTEVTVPDSVTSIGEGAFQNCDNLTKITLPFVGASKDAVGYQAVFGFIFGYWASSSSSESSLYTYQYYDSSVSSNYKYYYYDIPSSLRTVEITGTSIPNGAFRNCTNLQTVLLGDEVTAIGEYAFINSGLTEMMIPDSVESIGYGAFRECASLISVVLGDGVLSIGGNSFSECAKLTSVRLGNNLATVGYYAFHKCSSLKEIAIPDSVTSLGQYAFWECKSLESAVIGEGVSIVESYLFHSCSNLKTVKFGGNVGKISGQAFEGCVSLTEAILPKKVSSIGYQAFYGCKNLSNIPFPQGLAYIGNAAFKGCTSLTAVQIPLSVKDVVSNAFEDCACLTIYCEAESKPSEWKENWNYANRPVVWDCNNNDVAEDGAIYTIIDGIRYRLKNGFAEVVEQPTDITSASIPSRVIYKETVYPVTAILAGAFKGCNVLEYLSLPFLGTSRDAKTYLGVFGAIFGYTITTNGVDPEGTICQYSVYTSTYGHKFYHYYIPSSLKTVNVTDGNIGNYSFKECNSLTHMEIPDGMSVIPEDTFWLCSALTSVVIPSSVTKISENAFWGCDGLTQIFYKGTAEEWLLIQTDSGNYVLQTGNIYYYVENEKEVPASGNYWHYDEEGKVAIW